MDLVGGVLVQRLLRCTCVTGDAVKFALRRRDLIGAEQVHGDTSVEIVQLAEFQCPCFLGRNVRLNKFSSWKFGMNQWFAVCRL